MSRQWGQARRAGRRAATQALRSSPSPRATAAQLSAALAGLVAQTDALSLLFTPGMDASAKAQRAAGAAQLARVRGVFDSLDPRLAAPWIARYERALGRIAVAQFRAVGDTSVLIHSSSPAAEGVSPDMGVPRSLAPDWKPGDPVPPGVTVNVTGR